MPTDEPSADRDDSVSGVVPVGGPTPGARSVPRFAVLSAALAPVAMIGGWTLAAALQSSFDAVGETISALAAAPSAHPGVMTAGLAVTGACHVATALGLRGAATPGRVLLALGGVSTAAVAALPVDLYPQAHGIAAGVGFGALALWPALAGGRRGSGRPRRAPLVVTSAVLVGLVVVFVLELQGLTPDGGAATGLTERLAAGAQSLAPLGLVLALMARHARSTRRPAPAARPR
ncbi:hypothetical protein GCM10025865_08780 [Paraoerskovia sediminicola]|uniref:DUF998 domain-containing protein n=1 Tax=Paraoerskovia sediminicola TaxID=1138587 RepID=A0ABN6X9T7_9CELL|nr:DUF998 domain-containing protein [Paraoerskovia sediminicola]BDZ41579.1 hypothetical protein GCM10025865_08780 [Paraoerskovia sediminicola]